MPIIRAGGNSKESELQANQARPSVDGHSLTSSDDKHIIVRRFMEVDGISSMASRQVSVFTNYARESPKTSINRPYVRSILR